MNYQKIYDQIIERAKTRKLEGYKEKHHIIPRCIGGGNEKSNSVELTAREHFLCHWLLHEIYPDNSKLFYAFSMMCNVVPNEKIVRHKPSSKIYEYLKKKRSYFLIGNKNHLGKNHTEETKNKIRQNSLKLKHTEESKIKIGYSISGEKNGNYGREFSDEHKNKIGIASRNRSKESNKKISDSKKGNKIWLGKKHSEETKRKISETLKEKNKKK